jgi:hypothetical protein
MMGRTIWYRTVRMFADEVGKKPHQVIERALFEYWRRIITDHPESAEGYAAKYALDTLMRERADSKQT